MLSSVALLALCASSISAAETDPVVYPEVIEEIVVKAIKWCGIWPIQHPRLIGCEYVELEKKELSKVLE